MNMDHLEYGPYYEHGTNALWSILCTWTIWNMDQLEYGPYYEHGSFGI